MAAYESQGKSEEKKQRLIERREKLASLLAEERDMYEVNSGNCYQCTGQYLQLLHSVSLETLHRASSVT